MQRRQSSQASVATQHHEISRSSVTETYGSGLTSGSRSSTANARAQYLQIPMYRRVHVFVFELAHASNHFGL